MATSCTVGIFSVSVGACTSGISRALGGVGVPRDFSFCPGFPRFPLYLGTPDNSSFSVSHTRRRVVLLPAALRLQLVASLSPKPITA